MLPPDLQRIEHIREYCAAIEGTISRYGRSFEIFDADPDYQRSVSFSILQIGELSVGLSQAFKEQTAARIQWAPSRACGIWWPTATAPWTVKSSGRPLSPTSPC